MELSADVNGPTLVRIWDAPKSSYAQRFRHSIEPFAQVLYRTAIDNYNAIPKIESADSIVGSATSYTYGMNTRFYAKRTVDGPRAIPREVISATIQQTYNTDARSVLSDADQRSRNNVPTSHFTPVQVLVRTSPFDGVTGTFRTDYDGRYSRFRSFSADAGWERERISHIASWSNVRFRPDLLGQNVARQTHYFNSYTSPAVSAEPLRRHALAQLGRQVPVVDAASDRHLLQRAVLRVLRRVSVHRPESDTAALAPSRTRDFIFPSRLGASVTSRTSSAALAAPTTR